MKRLLLAASLFLALTASAQPMTLDAYIGALERIHAAMSANDLAGAKRLASQLVGAEVTSSAGTFRADDVLLIAVRDAKKADPTLRARLTATIAELRRTAPEAVPAADTKLLERVAADQRVDELRAGGEIELTGKPVDAPFLITVLESIVKAIEWIGEKLGELLDWFLELFPRRQKSGGSIGGPVIVVVAIIIAVLLALAIRTVLRGRGATKAPVVASEPITSRRDEDPLSRGATEWERYAAQLAAQERWREAIRAWYHAVLVTLYGTRVLQYRKGRTNWEYVAALSASMPWRAEMIELTRRFEHEWYGSLASTPDAYDDCGARARAILDAVRRGARGAA